MKGIKGNDDEPLISLTVQSRQKRSRIRAMVEGPWHPTEFKVNSTNTHCTAMYRRPFLKVPVLLLDGENSGYARLTYCRLD